MFPVQGPSAVDDANDVVDLTSHWLTSSSIVSEESDVGLPSSAICPLCVYGVVWILQEDPEPTKAKLEKFLESKGIPYKYGTKTKFANFRQRTLE